jgi:hypothetical protein
MAEDFISGALAGQQFKQGQEAIAERPQLFELSMAEGKQKLQAEALTIEERQMTLDNSKALQKLQGGVLKSLATQPTDPSADPTEQTTNSLFAIGTADILGGFPQQGGEFIKQATAIAKNHADITIKGSEAQQKKLSFVAGGLADVHDQQSWETFNMMAASEFKGAMDPKIAGKPYSPQLIKMLMDSTQTLLQKARTERENALSRLDAVHVQESEARVPLIRAQEQAALATAAAKRKNTGKASEAKAQDINRVADLITTSYPDVPKDQARTLAGPIAEEAVKLVKEQELTPPQAYHKAFNRARDHGSFWGLKEGRVRAGTAAEKPLPIPMADGKADLSAMTNNMFYSDPRYPGVSFVFDKARGGLVKVTEKAGSEAADDDEEPKDDEE